MCNTGVGKTANRDHKPQLSNPRDVISTKQLKTMSKANRINKDNAGRRLLRPVTGTGYVEQYQYVRCVVDKDGSGLDAVRLENGLDGAAGSQPGVSRGAEKVGPRIDPPKRFGERVPRLRH